MKNFQNFLLFVSLFSAISFAACHKHDDENDTTAPVLTIEDPIENESLNGEIHIHGKVTDESLHELNIVVKSDADGSVIFQKAPEVHDETSYSFDEHFTKAVGAETPVTLTITVSDHSDNTTTKSVKFKLKP
jgi:hypothetical protein